MKWQQEKYNIDTDQFIKDQIFAWNNFHYAQLTFPNA